MGVALITGASAGIGVDLAKLFAADQHDVILVARRKDRLETLADELRETYGIQAHAFAADLAQPGAADLLFDALQAADLRVDFLVNNAGFGTLGKFWELDAQREVDQIQVNVTSLVHLTAKLLPAMVQRDFGRILNVASTAGFQAGPYMSTYYATKAFVISFSEGLAHELADTRVTVTVHCPGATATEFSHVSGNEEARLFQMQKPATSKDVAQDAYDAMMAGKTLKIHGMKNAFGAFMAQVGPRGLATRLAAKMNEKP